MKPSSSRSASIAGLVMAAIGSATVLQDSEQESAAGDPERPIHTRIDLPSIAACGGCHLQVYKEWAQSLHRHAWTNANVRQATWDFKKRACRACHSPQPVLPHSLEKAPEYRDFNQDDGVHCLSCHGLEDGVAATRTIEGAPCKPKFEPRLVGTRLCYPCHQPTHQAYDEYLASDAFAVGVRCIDCHMPRRKDAPGRSHGPHGGLNPEFIKKSFHWRCETTADALLVTLRNRTGHKLPGEIPSRSLIVRVDYADDSTRYETLRRPAKTEDRKDNRLLPDEERTLRFPLGAGVRRVQFLWKPYPVIPEENAFHLAEWTPE